MSKRLILSAFLLAQVSIGAHAGMLTIDSVVLDDAGRTHIMSCKPAGGYFKELGAPGPEAAIRVNSSVLEAPLALALVPVVPEGWAINFQGDTRVLPVAWGREVMRWTERLGRLAYEYNLIVVVDWRSREVLIDQL